MALEAKLRSTQGSKKVEFTCDAGSGYVWISELGNGELRIAIYGEGFFMIEDFTKEA